MAVLVEALTVIVKKTVIDARLPGGYENFKRMVGSKAVCTDGQLAAGVFFTPGEVEQFIGELEAHGIRYTSDDGNEAEDIAVIDQQKGAMCIAPWIECSRVDLDGIGTVTAVAEFGSLFDSVITPDGWNFELSMSKEFSFVPTEEAHHLLHLTTESGVNTHVDLRTGGFIHIPSARRAGLGNPPNYATPPRESDSELFLDPLDLSLASSKFDLDDREMACIEAARTAAIQRGLKLHPAFASKPSWWRRQPRWHRNYPRPQIKSLASLWEMYTHGMPVAYDETLYCEFVSALYGNDASEYTHRKLQLLMRARNNSDAGWMERDPDAPLPTRRPLISLLRNEIEGLLPNYDSDVK